jgi:hypothetical protein
MQKEGSPREITRSCLKTAKKSRTKLSRRTYKKKKVSNARKRKKSENLCFVLFLSLEKKKELHDSLKGAQECGART